MRNKALVIAQQKIQHNYQLEAMGADGAIYGRPYIRLRLVEARMNRANEAYCNGEITDEQHEQAEILATKAVERIFNGKLPEGFFVNHDPRGYALKIDDEVMREYFEKHKEELLSYRDWGGYGILAPDFR